MSGELIVFIILGGVARLFGPVAGGGPLRGDGACAGRSVGSLAHLARRACCWLSLLFARGGLIGLLAGRARTHD